MGKTKALRTVLAILAFLFTTLATLLFFAQDRFLDSDDFGATAAASLADPAVNQYLATEISDALVDEVPNLATGGSLVETFTSGILESSAAQAVVQTSVSDAHRAVFEDDAESFIVDVSDIVLMVEQTLVAVVPDAAEAIPDDVEDIVVSISSGELFTTTLDAARALRRLTAIVAVLAVVSLLGLVVTDNTPWTGMSAVGLTLGLVGLFVLVVEVVGAAIVGTFVSAGPQRDAVIALWHLVFGELRNWGWILMAGGAFLAGLAWAVLNVGQARSVVAERLAKLTDAPTTTRGHLIRSSSVGVVAIWAIVEPLSLASVVLRLVGFVAAIAAVAEIVELTGLDKRLNTVAPAHSDIRSWRSLAGQAAVPVAVLAALVVGAVFTLSADGSQTFAAAPDACNGHQELCDRPFDQVAVAASHNSMSSPDTNFYLPNQTNTMLEQLDQGIRALLIDTWYGRPSADGIVVTDTDVVDTANLDAETSAAVEAARSRSQADLGERGVYLCHTVCEVGAVLAVSALTEIEQWLGEHPREVLTIVVQDATSPADTATLFEEAGLAGMAHVQEFGLPFPTLDEMIATNKRLFVMVEEDGGETDWLHHAFMFVQETPFSFASAEEFNCDMNRGREDSPFFMVNHFLTPALNANRDINLAEELRTRLKQCAEERGMTPTVIAADFVEYGDLVAVVDELNGFGS